MEVLTAREEKKRAKARVEMARLKREHRADVRRSTIYATIYPKAAPPSHRGKEYPLIFGFKGASQSDVENFLLCIGYGCSDYWLSLMVYEKYKYYVERVKITKFRKSRNHRYGIRWSLGMGQWK